MTHDELVKDLDACIKGAEYGPYEWGFIALRAVVELHKPIDAAKGLSQASRDILGYTNVCGECHYSGGMYPCDTIKAIEKELT
jgi:hypothetical protein